MNPDCLILRLGELTLKGRNRGRFEKSVMAQIRKSLAAFPDLRYKQEFGRVYVEIGGAPYDQISSSLNKVFGLTSYSPAFHVPLELEVIREQALGMMQALPQIPKTFKVSVRRVNKDFPYDTQQMNYLVGGYVLQACPGLKVDVHQPEVELRIELREQQALLYMQVIDGAGGFPHGSSGKALLLLSGGIDSPVAGWLAMRKGLELEAIHFHSYPYTSERAKQKVIDLTRKLSAYTNSIKLHLVPFTEVQTSIHGVYKDNLLVTIMRRAMYRIAEKVAQREELLALVTGESLGQVASQTLPSLNAIGRSVTLPILQPVMMLDKKEIVRLARQIETFEISNLPYEDCCTLFLPDNPSTNPNLRVVEKVEEQMDFLPQLEAEAIRLTETIVIRIDDKDEADEHLF
ncbi:tRNA uracil 4-sulfurtransferase ThiI [Paenibacillus eucommiae]|uniref:Probable tRNA sulfurtransferase n=1 Tax=Paenibacillus eucommiae TaxID=1355755 RepID=A0ABS4IZ24_9BACL|nr:tRNA uracil 4-sulfurtransferase ThiI [Paenibacillus eucommiae]MBP1992826.1 thiamine biosynthesis protein ThiI [Paenibacillus eucommiae]